MKLFSVRPDEDHGYSIVETSVAFVLLASVATGLIYLMTPQYFGQGDRLRSVTPLVSLAEEQLVHGPGPATADSDIPPSFEPDSISIRISLAGYSARGPAGSLMIYNRISNAE